jgi:hypothetical protein
MLRLTKAFVLLLALSPSGPAWGQALQVAQAAPEASLRSSSIVPRSAEPILGRPSGEAGAGEGGGGLRVIRAPASAEVVETETGPKVVKAPNSDEPIKASANGPTIIRAPKREQ